MENNTSIFLRVDAYPEIGTGHLKRCLTLARYLRSHYPRIGFIIDRKKTTLKDEIVSQGFSLHEISGDNDELYDVLNIINRTKGLNLLITDGDNKLFFSKFFQTSIIDSGIFLMTITMKADTHFHSHIVLNQNILALKQNYSTELYTRKLLGPDYIILDQRFSFQVDKPQPRKKDKFDILLSFGGADHTGLTCKVLKHILKFDSFINKVIIVLGALNKENDQISKLINNDKSEVKKDIYVDTEKMPELMMKSDVAITSGGLTLWELAYLGKPNLVISSSEREKITASELSSRNAIIYLGHHDDEKSLGKIEKTLKRFINDPRHIKTLSCHGEEMVDGQGTKRISDEIELLFTNVESNR